MQFPARKVIGYVTVYNKFNYIGDHYAYIDQPAMQMITQKFQKRVFWNHHDRLCCVFPASLLEREYIPILYPAHFFHGCVPLIGNAGQRLDVFQRLDLLLIWLPPCVRAGTDPTHRRYLAHRTRSSRSSGSGEDQEKQDGQNTKHKTSKAQYW